MSGFYYCVMGGSNAAGPVSSISVMNIGTYPGRGPGHRGRTGSRTGGLRKGQEAGVRAQD